MFLLCIILIRRIVCRVLEKLVVVDHGLKRLCMELKTVIDRVLKMNDWVLNMEKDKEYIWGTSTWNVTGTCIWNGTVENTGSELGVRGSGNG